MIRMSYQPVASLYYIGCYIKPMGTGMQTVAARFQVTVAFFGQNQFNAPNSGNISLSSNLLQTNNAALEPSINATFTTISTFESYVFFQMKGACGLDVTVNELPYVMEHMTPFLNVTFAPDDVPPEAMATLTGFDKSASVICINLVGYLQGVATVPWLAQTIYYPHQRDGIEPQKIEPKKWTAKTYVPLVLTALLFLCAPVGIVVHRIWMVRRRAQKRAISLASQGFQIN